MGAWFRFGAYRRVVGSLLLMLQLTACTGWRTQQVTPEVLIRSRQPSQVRLTRPDRTRLVIYHPTVAGDSIVGITYLPVSITQQQAGNPSSSIEEAPVAVAWGDIRRIETRGFSPGQTVLLGLGLGLAVLTILAIGTAGVLDAATPRY